MDEDAVGAERHEASADDAPTMNFGKGAVPAPGAHAMSAREFRAIAVKALTGKELTAEEREAYDAQKGTLEASARRLVSDSSSLMQGFEDMKLAPIHAPEVGVPSFSAEVEARIEARRARQDQLDALTNIVTEIQAQRLENQESARSSAVLNWWILGVSAGATVVGVIALIVSIVK